MRRAIVFAMGLIAIFALLSKCYWLKNVSANDEGMWKFAVSGDSRNCGDIVMPVIAERVLEEKAQFYWHLGDFRAIYKVDEDFVGQKMYMPKNGPGDLAISTYQILAWPDFIEHQIRPFGSLPVFLGIGNHETVMPKSREDYIAQFSAWLNSGPVQRQRVADYAGTGRLRRTITGYATGWTSSAWTTEPAISLISRKSTGSRRFSPGMSRMQTER